MPTRRTGRSARRHPSSLEPSHQVRRLPSLPSALIRRQGESPIGAAPPLRSVAAKRAEASPGRTGSETSRAREYDRSRIRRPCRSVTADGAERSQAPRRAARGAERANCRAVGAAARIYGGRSERSDSASVTSGSLSPEVGNGRAHHGEAP